MARHVKGTLFVDYVRMLKSRKDIDWSKYLNEEDMKFLDEHERIMPSSWYPFDTFERFGLGVLQEIGGGHYESARMWGRMSTDLLLKVYKNMIESGDPAYSVQKFDIVRAGFFDFPGVKAEILSESLLHMTVRFSTDKVIGKAQAYQALGAVERLLELAGAEKIEHTFHKSVWENDPETLIEMTWETPSK
ncbi:MAG: hypothetical protein GY854_11395 [Deltaproteobacteria bacterium]|nr:hypothetical protein [Deltaproteobacteria bacterium]